MRPSALLANKTPFLTPSFTHSLPPSRPPLYHYSCSSYHDGSDIQSSHGSFLPHTSKESMPHSSSGLTRRQHPVCSIVLNSSSDCSSLTVPCGDRLLRYMKIIRYSTVKDLTWGPQFSLFPPLYLVSVC